MDMEYMVPASIRLNLANGTLFLLDEVRIGLSGRVPPYRSNISAINLNDQHIGIPAGESMEVRIGISPSKSKLFLRRYVAWVLTATAGPG